MFQHNRNDAQRQDIVYGFVKYSEPYTALYEDLSAVTVLELIDKGFVNPEAGGLYPSPTWLIAASRSLTSYGSVGFPTLLLPPSSPACWTTLVIGIEFTPNFDASDDPAVRRFEFSEALLSFANSFHDADKFKVSYDKFTAIWGDKE